MICYRCGFCFEYRFLFYLCLLILSARIASEMMQANSATSDDVLVQTYT